MGILKNLVKKSLKGKPVGLKELKEEETNAEAEALAKANAANSGKGALQEYTAFGRQFLPGLGALMGMGGPGGAGATPPGMPQAAQPSAFSGGISQEEQLAKARAQYVKEYGAGDPAGLAQVSDEWLRSTYPSIFTQGTPTTPPVQPGTTAPGEQVSGIQATLENLPGYQFQRDQGMQAITREASAAGFRGSGNVLYDMANYSSGLASSNYSNYFNQMYNLANMGLSAAGAQEGVALQQQQLAQNAEAQKGQKNSGIGSLLGMAAGAYFGGPMGAQVGAGIGGSIGGMF